MYSGEIKPKNELATVYIDWLEAAQYFKAGSTTIHEVNDQNISKNLPIFGSPYLVNVNPEELNITVHLLVMGRLLDIYRGYEAWNVYIPITPLKQMQRKYMSYVPIK
jgi:hypothetical protein